MRLIYVIAILALSGCSQIKNYEVIKQETNTILSTHIGGQILKIKRSSDLPNAFGNADLYGGKIDQGYTELRYQGLTKDNLVIFRITETETSSTETTMSRYGTSHSTINTNGTINTYHPPKGSTYVLPPNTTEFTVDINNTKYINISGVKIEFVSANKTSIVYKLNKSEAKWQN